MSHTVGDVAGIAHVSVRTLHYYDEIGLLVPQSRSESGYRLYSDEDLERLQQILLYRQLGFSLEATRELMSDEAYDRQSALVAQRDMITEQVARLEAVIGLIDKTLAHMEGVITMSTEELFEALGDFDPSEYEDEVKERWGDTDAYKESARRAASYTKADWTRFRDKSQEINSAIAALMDEGVSADDPRAMDAVERHRLQIDEWFYPCSREMHANLGRMYVTDPRFTATYEKIRPGMAQYVCDATAANAARTAPEEDRP